jgi:hypothetical protein
MPDRTWRESWVAALERYESLSGSDWAHIPRFKQLVAELAASKEAFGLTAVTSHEVLSISPYTKYADWFEGRRVVLEPLPSGDVRVEYRPAAGAKNVHAEAMPIADARSVVLRLMSEL